MKFFNRHTFWTICKKIPSMSGTTIEEVAATEMKMRLTNHDRVHIEVEYNWHKNKRPYYNVYPAIASSLIKVSLDFDCSLLKMPLPVLLVRFSEENPPITGDLKLPLRSVMAAKFDKIANEDGVETPGLGIWCDRGEVDTVAGNDCPVYDFQILMLKPGMTIEESISRFGSVCSHEDDKSLSQALRIVVGVCMLADDPEIIVPDVLEKDKGKEISDAIVQRAVKRDKVGWIVGQKIEVIPHVRRPHFGIRWVGKGRTEPKICRIKGSVVHRNAVKDIPTGFQDAEQ